MKDFVFFITVLALSFVLGGCEKTDYKHPLHRAQGK